MISARRAVAFSAKQAAPLVSLACWVLLAATAASGAQPAGPAVAPLAAAHNASGQMLLRQFGDKPGNIVFSPHSVGTAMDMTLAGARGATQAQMKAALHRMLPLEDIDAANKALREQIARAAGSGIKNLSANALMLAGAGINKDYADLLRTQYGAEIFTGATPDTVNGWVNGMTEGKIPTLLKSVEPRGAVILNAVYFKAAWQSRFDVKETRDSEFHLSARRTVQVPTMRQRGSFAYVDHKTFAAVRLPYSGSDMVAMVVVRPAQIEGAKEVAAALGAEPLAALFQQLRQAKPVTVDLALPRFRAEFEADLGPAFRTAGMTDAFSEGKADFSRMISDRSADGLFIGAIVHKAFIDVGEEGAEAAAATAVTMSRARSMPNLRITTFHVDRPFLFYILDMDSGAILFQGRISDPGGKAA
jgi:serpin B